MDRDSSADRGTGSRRGIENMAALAAADFSLVTPLGVQQSNQVCQLFGDQFDKIIQGKNADPSGPNPDSRLHAKDSSHFGRHKPLDWHSRPVAYTQGTKNAEMSGAVSRGFVPRSYANTSKSIAGRTGNRSDP